MIRAPLAAGGLLCAGLAAATVGDERALPGHVAQKDIESKRWTAAQLKQAGKRLFAARFRTPDGAGRPGATGDPSPTRRALGTDASFTRISGLDANSCAGCHNLPCVGGAGEFAGNVFTGGGLHEPALDSTHGRNVAERGTPSLFGGGLIELLAREMSVELIGIRESARRRAKAGGKAVRVELVTKKVSFGYLTANPDGTVKLTEVRGVDPDLVVRPWSQKGTVSSLRTFSVNALNLHHGMQASERFGVHATGAMDYDRDGMPVEITDGDITAITIFQATLPVPRQVMPTDPVRRRAASDGRAIFDRIGCAVCHMPELVLDRPVFAEPGIFNLEGTLRRSEIERPFEVDLAADLDLPREDRMKDGKVIVRAFTDLKRHRICDQSTPHYCNEQVVQGFAATDEFVTKRLWEAGSTDPFGHRKDLTTLREAILHHGGEATGSRLAFEGLGPEDQAKLIEFLKSLKSPCGEDDDATLPYQPPL